MISKKIVLPVCLFCFIIFPVQHGHCAGKGKRIEKPVEDSIKIRRKTQENEEQWRLEKEGLLAAYEQLLEENRLLEERHSELSKTHSNARERMLEKEKQLAEIKNISNQIGPFLEELITALDERLDDGLPFLIEERENRIARLKTIMDDPEVSVSEKYRKVMEALMVEAEYGFTIEVMQETIEINDQNFLVNIFRLGRISLFFQTLDHKQGGYYNVAEGRWAALPQEYLSGIDAAVKIGARQKTAEIISLPLGRIVVQ